MRAKHNILISLRKQKKMFPVEKDDYKIQWISFRERFFI